MTSASAPMTARITHLEMTAPPAQGDVTIHTWSEEEKKKFRQIAQEQWQPYGERSENAQKVYDKLTTYLKSAGLL